MKPHSIVVLLIRVLCAAAAASCLQATAADLRVLAPNATKASVSEAVTNFVKSSGNTVIVSWAGTEAITKRITEGEVVDIVVNAAQNIDRLTTQGKLSQGSRTDFARSSIGVAVAPSAVRPDVSSIEGLKSALLGAKSIVISSGTSGRYLSDLFNSLGVGDQIKAKVKQPPSGAQIADVLAAGEAELGFQQISELLHVDGIQFLGPIPAEIQNYTIYSGAAHTRAPEFEAAQAFLRALREPETAAVVRKSGMEPL
ncbi:MAG: molybdenum ABC transporter substrate-binding protein [Candidatus Accumulibacter phosphatis]|jgi:molybdate transport system substrate-binding protein|uniref:substrate-binding domain-containing protein n=1 Tax=Candidatus Accumulibacter sp. ACC005 TaxID=2823331 RepID=UPI0012CF49E5|nr:substrate-binding domain-containing protein [Candidatus Accumulibacter sp. ACC005]MQM35917.1 molybdenum ABC transporter substrate-binding protein [Candidatus Accumulibacter phosphatis]